MDETLDEGMSGHRDKTSHSENLAKQCQSWDLMKLTPTFLLHKIDRRPGLAQGYVMMFTS
jgi:hypothetical protein